MCLRGYASPDPCHCMAQKRGCVPGKALPDASLTVFAQVAKSRGSASEYTSPDPCHRLAQKRGCVPGKLPLIGPSHAFAQVARFATAGGGYASPDPCHRLAQIRGCVPRESASSHGAAPPVRKPRKCRRRRPAGSLPRFRRNGARRRRLTTPACACSSAGDCTARAGVESCRAAPARAREPVSRGEDKRAKRGQYQGDMLGYVSISVYRLTL